MRKLLLSLAILVVWVGGCGVFTDSFESISEMDRDGKCAQAIQAYQAYLQHHPHTVLKPRIYYRIAQNYETLSDYTDAIKWYEKVSDDCPQTDEEIHALLDLAALYRDKVKNNAAALEWSQKAYDRYMDNLQLKETVQSLIEAQYLSADAFYLQKNYKSAADAADRVFQTFPADFIQPETQAKIESLEDRARRADLIAKSSVELIVLRSETPYNKSFDDDFPPQTAEGGRLLSPDGKLWVERKKTSEGPSYLYLAQVPVKGNEAVFKPIGQTFGANFPTWSADSRDLVYTRTVRGLEKLEETDIQKLTTRTLFFTKRGNLGPRPVFHPSGNKIAYVYGGEVWLINADGIVKSGLKTNQKLDYTADLEWSKDGTMLLCRQAGPHGIVTSNVLTLDASTSFHP